MMEKVLGELCTAGRDFTGFISVESGESLYLLFFFNSRPYAAGKAIGKKPTSLTIRELFQEIGQLDETNSVLSIHATDPVLLKCLLIFIQENPAVKAPSNLINLEAILEQIRQEAANALIILEKQDIFNFFFFKDGTKGMSYFADIGFSGGDKLAIDEQMLVYAFQGGGVPVDALIYRSVATKESTDSVLISQDEMLRLLWGLQHEEQQSKEEAKVQKAGIIEDNLVLAVMDGPQKGQILSGPIPCVIGRKDTDIIVSDPMVSKRHVAVQMVNGKLMLVDLNSTNGTTVNGRPVKQHNITGGDVISMGGTALKVLRITPP
jgi:hypothetical protein